MVGMPFKVKAIYDYSSPHDDDLNFTSGQIITVTEEEDAEWYVGEYTSENGVEKNGLFPRNFVERYEPQAPPRPTRSRPKAEPPPGPEPSLSSSEQPLPEAASVTRPEDELKPPDPEKEDEGKVADEQQPPQAVEPPPAPKPQSANPAPALASAKPPPPETASKPPSNSFKDRIAAFNKSAAPPVAPKPAGAPGGQNFIKKPFVAPPPARNAYVPTAPKQDAPQKVYRREEDPEMAQQIAQGQKEAIETGLAGGFGERAEVSEDAPPSTSLKDRIAILQKQQEEQAARRAEGAGKSKRPGKPRSESNDGVAHESQGDVQSAARVSRGSSDIPRPVPARTISHEPVTEDLARDIVSDGNEADQSGAGETTEDAGGDSTEVEDTPRRSTIRAPAAPSRTSTLESRETTRKRAEHEQRLEPQSDDDREDEEEGQDEDQEDIDPETRRREELRARMAKMSGGMGMPGMFGMPAPRAPAPPRKSSEVKASSTDARSPPLQQRIPMIPIAGTSQRLQSPSSSEQRVPIIEKETEPLLPDTMSKSGEAVPDVEELTPRSHEQAHADVSQPPSRSQDRPVPPIASKDATRQEHRSPTEQRTARPVPPPPPRVPPPDDSDEDADEVPPGVPAVTRAAPAVQTDLPHRAGSTSTSYDTPKHTSRAPSDPQFSPQTLPPSSQTPMTRAPPPIPAGSPQMPPLPTQARPPPPPPPSAVPRFEREMIGRTSADARNVGPEDDGDSEYEGDYDTDIAPTATHKDALKSRVAREASLDDDSTLSEGASGRSPVSAPPPVPKTQKPPPPAPPQQAPPSRISANYQRAELQSSQDDEEAEYDPYRYDGLQGPPSRASTGPVEQSHSAGTMIVASPQETLHRGPPSVPPTEPPRAAQTSLANDDRESMDEPRRSINPPRKSMTGRRSLDPGSRPLPEDGGCIARDIDLSRPTMWWASPETPPPMFQNRSDILFESEEATASKRGGRTITNKDVYILFQDYSQTIITAQYDTKDPAHDAHLEQRHEDPPPRLRQDQLEAVYSKYGEPIAAMATTKQNQTIGTGAPQDLVLDLMRSSDPNVLLPVGVRAFGALVYSNMANSSVSQYDEIRPGDIVSFRNAKFKGKHGAMHAKYSMDVGRPDHVGVVIEWDGTKKKIRALEQGREKGKSVRMESFRVGDLGAGEVKVWRVVGRDYVGWENNA